MLFDQLCRLTGFVLGAFRRAEQRIFAARDQEQKAVLRPVKGWDELGSILNGQPA